MRIAGFLVTISLALGGCAAAPMRALDAPVTALPAPAETPLWAALVAPDEAAAGRSGFFFLESGLDAYHLRLTAIEAATQTVDIQYYIWHFDGSGRAISEALLRAAERGVRVRALVDGFHIDRAAAPLKRIARHPNVEVRIYNAFRSSFRSNVRRYTELIFDFSRLNQRMHNKIVAVDNTLAIVGGRNVNDAYFGLDAKHYFLDRDVVIAGPLTAEISASFDAFWNDPHAVPARDFARDDASSVNAGTVWAEAPDLALDEFPLPRRIEGAALAEKFDDLRGRFVWAPAMLTLTSPGPVFAGPARLPAASIEAVLLSQLGAAREEIVVQMSYVMLTEAREAALAEANARGVRMVLQTNSLASTDSAIVHYGYARDRRRFLRHDVALYELKNVPQNARGMAQLGIVPEKTTLHPKTMVFDGRHVFLGSFNLDHRSILYNSEIGILIDSPLLAMQVLGAIAWDMAPANSWRVALEPPRHLVWYDDSETPPRRLDSEPNTGIMAQILTWIGYFLPIDHLL